MSLDYTDWESEVIRIFGECRGPENWCYAHHSPWFREVCQVILGIMERGQQAPNPGKEAEREL